MMVIDALSGPALISWVVPFIVAFMKSLSSSGIAKECQEHKERFLPSVLGCLQC